MKITDLLDENCIRVPLKASEKTSAITELVDALHEAGRLTDRDAVLRAVLVREETKSTGIGEGLAVPHGKTTGCPKLSLAIGKPATPIDFGGRDGEHCVIIFLLASPVDETGPHIQALGRISRIWLTHEFRQDAAKASSSSELFSAIRKHQPNI